ncbi:MULTISPECIES: MipA/OmpV family protein [Gibbsiella]|uniref:MipA/OmpV family protein n=1 Tax=Gibbsiella dentisursi TaxID=796890 RepID=A0ABP7LAX3_9GAMM|nr:MipA/OmpV family protein [Gibbsiella quercinecans]
MSDTHRFPARRYTPALICLACALAVLPQASQAQPIDPLAPAPTSLFGDKTDVNVGFGASIGPRYMGARQTRVSPELALSVSRGIFFIDTLRGIGAEYLTDSGFYLSGALSYDLGRKDENSTWQPGSKRLRGMGEVKGATTADFLISQQITSWLAINSEAEFRVAGADRGNRYRVGLEGTVFRDSRDAFTLGVNVHAGDSRYNRTYFGVSEEQHRHSRFSRFDAKSGIYAYSASADWEHNFDQNWSLFVGLEVMTFSDRAHRSPVVEGNTNVTGIAMLNYTF